jgi:hypothetical protein
MATQTSPKDYLVDRIEYFEVRNPRIDASIHSATHLKRELIMKEALHRFEVLSEFLRSMACTTVVSSHEEGYREVPVIYGAMFVDAIVSSADDWIEIMERLMPPDEGWQFKFRVAHRTTLSA